MATVRIDISALKLQKTTEKAYVFVSNTPRKIGGDFDAEVLSLPKSLTNVVNQRISKVNHNPIPTIVEIPKWLFDKNVTGNKKLEAKIRVL